MKVLDEVSVEANAYSTAHPSPGDEPGKPPGKGYIPFSECNLKGE